MRFLQSVKIVQNETKLIITEFGKFPAAFTGPGFIIQFTKLRQTSSDRAQYLTINDHQAFPIEKDRCSENRRNQNVIHGLERQVIFSVLHHHGNVISFQVQLQFITVTVKGRVKIPLKQLGFSGFRKTAGAQKVQQRSFGRRMDKGIEIIKKDRFFRKIKLHVIFVFPDISCVRSLSVEHQIILRIF